MKIFLDTCDVESVRNAADTGLISGVTTNPSLAKKANRPDYRKNLQEICNISGLSSVSAQVRENQNSEKIIEEAYELEAICPGKITIKVPMNPHGLKAVRTLAQNQISTNVTLVFTPAQAQLAMDAGANFVSYFMGRQEEATREKFPGQIRQDLEKMAAYKARYGFNSMVLAASIRDVTHVQLAADCGADVASVPPAVFWEMFSDPLGLTKAGLEKFLKDREFLTE